MHSAEICQEMHSQRARGLLEMTPRTEVAKRRLSDCLRGGQGLWGSRARGENGVGRGWQSSKTQRETSPGPGASSCGAEGVMH